MSDTIPATGQINTLGFTAAFRLAQIQTIIIAMINKTEVY